ncbi:MAG: hypothetical protein ACREPX_01385, partial [Rhodanobacteraceae bacterium]
KGTRNPDLQALFRLTMMLAAKSALDWFNGTKASGKKPMTCVEVATTAFWQADPIAHKYALQVQVVRQGAGTASTPMASVLSPAELAQYRAAHAQIHTVLANTAPHLLAPASKGGAQINDVPPQTVEGAMLSLCTPRDMETSPTLKFVGCLQDKNAGAGKRAG